MIIITKNFYFLHKSKKFSVKFDKKKEEINVNYHKYFIENCVFDNCLL